MLERIYNASNGTKFGRCERERKRSWRLIDEHKLFDITDPKYEAMMGKREGWKRDWMQTKRKFIEAVEELFVEDACNSF